MKVIYAALLFPVLSGHAASFKRQASVTAPPNNTTPSSISANDSDTTLLNFALSIENLQNAFYTQGLSQFDEQSFNSSGFSPSVRNGFVQIGQSKEAHVLLLNTTLGTNASQPCNYTFSINNVTSFTILSQLLENIGTSAYIGSVQNITNKTFSTAAASILATNARFATWVASSVNGVEPWDGAFDTPLTPDQVTTLTKAYISSCPGTLSSFTSFPDLTISQGLPGSNVTFTFNANSSASSNETSTNGTSSMNGTSPTNSTSLFAAFFQGLNHLFVPIQNGTVTLPSNLAGLVYAVVTNSSSSATDNTIVAGPAILSFEVASNSTGNGTSTGIGPGNATSLVPSPSSTTSEFSIISTAVSSGSSTSPSVTSAFPTSL